MENNNDSKTTGSHFAILLLVHKNINQVGRLIKRLSHDRIDIFIHVDKKLNLTDGQIDFLLSLNNGRVYMCKQRFSICLFSYSMVKAELALVSSASQHGHANKRHYCYYLLLSGQDYPIKPIEKIISTLENNFPKPYIDTTMWHEKNWVNTSFGKVYGYKEYRNLVRTYINNKIKNQVLNKVLRGINHVIFSVVSKAKQLVVKTPYIRMKNMSLEVAGGSQWFILPELMALEALKYARNRKFNQIFKDVGSADETFFQSVMVNSAFKDNLTINRWDETTQRTCTYTDFYGDNVISNGHPIILTEKDFNELSLADAFFARKFDENVNSEILDLIDSRLLINTD